MTEEPTTTVRVGELPPVTIRVTVDGRDRRDVQVTEWVVNDDGIREARALFPDLKAGQLVNGFDYRIGDKWYWGSRWAVPIRRDGEKYGAVVTEDAIGVRS